MTNEIDGNLNTNSAKDISIFTNCNRITETEEHYIKLVKMLFFIRDTFACMDPEKCYFRADTFEGFFYVLDGIATELQLLVDKNYISSTPVELIAEQYKLNPIPDAVPS